MAMVLYGDFREAPSRAAARLVDLLVQAGIEVEWRAVTRHPIGDVLPSCAALAAERGARAHAVRSALFDACWESLVDIDDPKVLERVFGAAPVFDEARARYWQRAWQGFDQPDLPLLRLKTGYVFRGSAGTDQLADLLQLRAVGGGSRRREHRRAITLVTEGRPG